MKVLLRQRQPAQKRMHQLGKLEEVACSLEAEGVEAELF